MSCQMGIKFPSTIESLVEKDLMETIALRVDLISIYTELT